MWTWLGLFDDIYHLIKQARFPEALPERFGQLAGWRKYADCGTRPLNMWNWSSATYEPTFNCLSGQAVAAGNTYVNGVASGYGPTATLNTFWLGKRDALATRMTNSVWFTSNKTALPAPKYYRPVNTHPYPASLPQWLFNEMPEILPPGQVWTMPPAATPYRVIPSRVTNPNRVPGHTSERGYQLETETGMGVSRKPGTRTKDPLVPSISQFPGSRPINLPGKPHVRKRPGPRVKERKSKIGPIGARRIRAAVNFVTEGLDLVESFYKALPERYRKQGLTPQEKAELIYRHIGEARVIDVVYNIAQNHIEDYAYGQASQAIQRGGTRFTGPAAGTYRSASGRGRDEAYARSKIRKARRKAEGRRANARANAARVQYFRDLARRG
jgi:hypothetical protein